MAKILEKAQKKSPDYYLGLDYPLHIRPLADEEGGYYAVYPDFGSAAAHGDGATIEAAIQEANLSKRLVIESLLAHGEEIPEPGSDAAYSGKFNVRMPKSLHRRLVEEAEREGVSLNMLVVSRLSRSA